MYYTYVLKSLKDGHLYTGFTHDLKSRLKSHNSGKVRSTKARRPLVLAYYEKYSNKEEARKREIFLKTGQGRKFLYEKLK